MHTYAADSRYPGRGVPEKGGVRGKTSGCVPLDCAKWRYLCFCSFFSPRRMNSWCRTGVRAAVQPTLWHPLACHCHGIHICSCQPGRWLPKQRPVPQPHAPWTASCSSKYDWGRGYAPCWAATLPGSCATGSLGGSLTGAEDIRAQTDCHHDVWRLLGLLLLYPPRHRRRVRASCSGWWRQRPRPEHQQRYVAP